MQGVQISGCRRNRLEGKAFRLFQRRAEAFAGRKTAALLRIMVSQGRGLVPGSHLGGHRMAFIQREISGAFAEQRPVTALGGVGGRLTLKAGRRKG